MRTSIYEKFEELLAKIKDMIARYPNIGWRCEKTIFNYCGGDVLKVDFYFRDIRYFDNNVKLLSKLKIFFLKFCLQDDLFL